MSFHVPRVTVTATPASVSDTEIGRAPDIIGEESVGARWVCTSCHLAQTDAEPLVANTAPLRELAGDAADEEALR